MRPSFPQVCGPRVNHCGVGLPTEREEIIINNLPLYYLNNSVRGNVKKLNHVKAGLKGSITVLIKNLADFSSTASTTEIRATKQSTQKTLGKSNDINDKLYELLEAAEID